MFQHGKVEELLEQHVSPKMKLFDRLLLLNTGTFWTFLDIGFAISICEIFAMKCRFENTEIYVKLEPHKSQLKFKEGRTNFKFISTILDLSFCYLWNFAYFTVTHPT